MNKTRLAKIIKIANKIIDIDNALDEILATEQKSRDNTPESLMTTDRYRNTERAIGELENASQGVADVKIALQKIIDNKYDY